MRIDSAGNVGIGVVPTYPLDILASVGNQVHIANTAGSGAQLYLGVGTGAGAYMQFGMDTPGTRFVSIGNAVPGTATSADMIFAAYNGSAWAERMRMANGGGVRIGTTAITPANVGDLSVGRDATPTAGVIYFGNGGNYLYFDGSAFNFTAPVNATGYINSGVKTQSVVTASRALGTVYQNTTGKAMFVVVTASGTPSSGTPAGFAARTDSSSSPGTTVANTTLTASSGGAQTMVGTISFWVLPNNYYQVVQASGGASLQTWVEWS
jgi:prepilin-type processing-associated H-X9-DG protein